MLASIKRLLFPNDAEAEAPAGGHSPGAVHHAAVALLVEASLLDGGFDAAERGRVATIVQTRFGFDDADIAALIDAAEAAARDAVELYTLCRTVRAHFDHDERVAMIEMLWEIVYGDGRLHHYEANMLRRVAGLLYVSDRENGTARKRVLQRLGLPDETPAG